MTGDEQLPAHRLYVRVAIAASILATALMALLFVSVKLEWRAEMAHRFIVIPLMWVLPAVAVIGAAGPFVTGQKRWLLLALAAMVAGALMFAAVLARSTWGT